MSKAENPKHAHAYILFTAIFIINSHVTWTDLMMSQRLGYLTSWGQTDGNPETETHEHVASCQMCVCGIGMLVWKNCTPQIKTQKVKNNAYFIRHFRSKCRRKTKTPTKSQ